jgi:hypothetical protein
MLFLSVLTNLAVIWYLAALAEEVRRVGDILEVR